MYSLVNIAPLVRDVARVPTAARTTRDLLRAFALDAAALAELDQAVPDRRDAALRDAVVREHGARPRALPVLAAARSMAADIGIDAYAAAADVLDRATMFGPEELIRFVRHDVLAAGWSTYDGLALARHPRALDVVTDGVLSSWCDDERVGAQWRHWVAVTEPPLPPAPRTPVFDALYALPRNAAFGVVSSGWAWQMHEACWALDLTDRLRAAAVAQLHALLVVLDVYAPGLPPHRAVAHVGAAVHADTARDLLADETYHAMTQPLFRLVS